jgi:alpha-L-rhamnosidase
VTNEECRIVDLTCEYKHDPMGIDVAAPRLAWRLVDGRRGQGQVAYRIAVASSPELLDAGSPDLWDSGQVEGDASTQVAYAGPGLESRQRCYWQVQVWPTLGAGPILSAVACWEMGLLSADDWQADWIMAPWVGGPNTSLPCPLMRRVFSVDRPIKRARLYITALGLYECSINGQRVGDDVLAPGWSDYAKRVHYQTHDITDLLRKGENAIGGALGDGWYCGHLLWTSAEGGRQQYGDRPRLLAQLEIEDADGRTHVVCSDQNWRCAMAPTLSSDFYMGEAYDTDRELSGWDTTEFDAADWQSVRVADDPAIAIGSSPNPPIRITEELPALSVNQVQGPARWVFDLGQNMVGVIRLRLRQPKGRRLTIRYAEALNADGKPYRDNLRSAVSTDHYHTRGDGEEVWQPRFTFHGFRYVEIIGLEGQDPPALDTVTGLVMHTDLAPTGAFTCTNVLINRLHANIQWGQRGNFLDVPTDCPQRDERFGWTGDAQAFARTACFNMQSAAFFTKWLTDLSDSQMPSGALPPWVPILPNGRPDGVDGGPGWSDAALIVPWTLYRCYGDTRILSACFPTIKRWLAHVEDRCIDGVRSHPDDKLFRGFGDWLDAATIGNQDWTGGTDKDLLGMAFHAHSCALAAQIADVIDEPSDAEQYRARRAEIKTLFQSRYCASDGTLSCPTQTAHILALHFDLLSDKQRRAAIAWLEKDITDRGMHLSTGFLGTPYILHALSAAGLTDLAYELLLQEEMPSWLFPVTAGATTVWERWNGWTEEKGFADPGMNSFNHYAYGCVGSWLYQTVAGLDLDPDVPGYRRVVLHPHPGGGLTRASAELHSMYGPVRSSWELTDDTFRYEVELPPGVTAKAILPVERLDAVRESGKPLSDVEGVTVTGHGEHGWELELQSGSYRFDAPSA